MEKHLDARPASIPAEGVQYHAEVTEVRRSPWATGGGGKVYEARLRAPGFSAEIETSEPLYVGTPLDVTVTPASPE